MNVEPEISSSAYYALYKDLEKVVNEGIRINNKFRSTLAAWEGSRQRYKTIENSGVYLNYGLTWICTLSEIVLHNIDDPERGIMEEQLKKSSKILGKQKDQLLDLKNQLTPAVPSLDTDPEDLIRLLYKLHLTLSRIMVAHKGTLEKVPKSKQVWKYADHNMVEAEIYIGQSV